MSDTIIYASKDRTEANQFTLNRKALGENVVEISSVDVVELVKDDAMQPAWYSGFNSDWIVIIATSGLISTK